MRIFSLAGIPIYVNIYFAGMLAIYTAAGLARQVILLFMLVITHELAHLVVARLCGVEVLGIEVFPFGGVARTAGLPAGEPLVEAAVAAAGPLHNIALYGLGAALARIGHVDGELLTFYLDANLSLALLNMIPALPLDGGRIARGLIAQAAGYRRATAVLGRAGTVAAVCMAAWGLAAALRGEFIPNAFAFAFFLAIAGRSEVRSAGYTAVRALFAKRESLRMRGAMPAVRVAAPGSMRAIDLALRLSPARRHFIAVTDPRGDVIGEIWEARLLDCVLEGRGGERLDRLLRDNP